MAIKYQEEQPLFNMRLGHGITVRVFATGTDWRGAETYLATVRQNGRVIFDDLTGAFSPMHASDGKEAREHILSHVAIKPGDTDREFFDGYTADQLDWLDRWADHVIDVKIARYGWGN